MIFQSTYSQYYYQNIGGGASPAQEQFVEKTDWVRLREVLCRIGAGKVIKSKMFRATQSLCNRT